MNTIYLYDLYINYLITNSNKALCVRLIYYMRVSYF